MKKFNKVLALGLVGVSALTGGLMLAGCDITEDKDKTQTEQSQDEQKAVSSISLNADTLPSYIIKGKFARTNITMTVTYEDNTTKVIDVTESMLDETSKEEIKYVGQYNLTINYGGKTTTMYANVVDERYLLKEVVENNLDKDVTITAGDYTSKLDMDNKIIYNYDVSNDYTNWIWLNNNVCYDYEVEDGITIDKNLATEFYDIVNDTYEHLVLNMLNGVADEGRAFTINTIERVGLNYILTATSTNDGVEGAQYKYYFNEDFLSKVEMIDDGVIAETYNFNYSIVNLEVPAEIKALESEATVNVENRIYDLKDTMSKYLESDFEMSVFVNELNSSFMYQKYDANNKVLKEYGSDVGDDELSWINGDYYYGYCGGDALIYKDEVFNWDRHIMVNCFTFDEVFDANYITVDISEDGEYYELVLTSEDGDGEIWEYKYVFNYEEIAKIDIKCDGQYMGAYTYNRTDVELEVPADIKALESSAQEDN